MVSFDENFYYNPENRGVKIVASWDHPHLGHEHCAVLVLKDQKGQLYIGQDDGCSCPAPFEDYDTLDDFTKVRNLAEIAMFIRSSMISDDYIDECIIRIAEQFDK